LWAAHINIKKQYNYSDTWFQAKYNEKVSHKGVLHFLFGDYTHKYNHVRKLSTGHLIWKMGDSCYYKLCFKLKKIYNSNYLTNKICKKEGDNYA